MTDISLTGVILIPGQPAFVLSDMIPFVSVWNIMPIWLCEPGRLGARLVEG